MFKITHFPQTDFQFDNFGVIDGSMKNLLEKFNTAETWIDVDILAKLKGVSKRAIRLSFNSKNSKYETKIEKGKGGKLYKIRLSSIEEDLQLKYIREYYDTLATTNNIVELHNFQASPCLAIKIACLGTSALNLLIKVLLVGNLLIHSKPFCLANP